LDAALCMLIGLHSRLHPQFESLFVGDVTTG
jgi:predicted RNase H-like nuclease